MLIKKCNLLLLLFTHAFAYAAEEVLSNLSLEQKLAQLFIIGVDNSGYLSADEVAAQPNSLFASERVTTFTQAFAEQLISKYEVGGVHFIGYGTVPSSLRAIHELQELSALPLLISQDFEWGLKMRLRDAIKFPYNITLGAIQDNNLIYELGKEIARQCILLGVHINFAPDADINSNPKNPVINFRSFGQDKENVAAKSICFMRGLQDGGIIACAKHFCGHGDTEVDSHLTLPVLNHSLQRLFEVELYPFKKLIDAGVKSIMSAHIHVPILDSRQNRSATLSKPIMTDVLKNQLGFTGLVITDALNMKGVSNYNTAEEIAFEAYGAGNDILLMSEDVPAAIERLKKALNCGDIDENDLNSRVLKILKAKEALGLFNRLHRNEDTNFVVPVEHFHTEQALQLKQKLYEAAITLVNDVRASNVNTKTLALKEKKFFSYIQIGGGEGSAFAAELAKDNGNRMQCLFINKDADAKLWQELLEDIKHQTIIVTLFEVTNQTHLSYGVSQETIRFIAQLTKLQAHVIFTIFGNPYCLQLFTSLPTTLMAYEPEVEAQVSAAKIIMGQLPALGILPIKLV